tara:strand:- start:3239 stop:3409 length:171 start_codon:yes stop_codon:yes gene_type:complete
MSLEDVSINKGVELILGGNTRPAKPKTWELSFGKIVTLWNTEIDFFFKVHLDIKKK